MHGAPPGHRSLVYRHRALPTEGGSLRGRASGGKWTSWCTVRSWTGLVVLRGVVLRCRMVCCMVGHWPLRNRCYLLGRCYMMGSVASIVACAMVLCMMFSVMFAMMTVVAVVASGTIWGCKGSPNN